MHRLDFKVFLGSAVPGRREQASQAQWDTRVLLLGCRAADQSRGLNYAALIVSSMSRPSPPVEAAAPALTVVTLQPRNPHAISNSAISGNSPRGRACPVPRGRAQQPSSAAAL